MADERNDSLRAMAAGLAALLAVSVLVGGVISVLALGAMNVTGLSGSDGGQAPEPSLYLPSPSESETPARRESDGKPSATPSPDGSASETARPEKEKKRPKQRRRITLAADPEAVGQYERINLSGTYPGADGTTLQVQRLENGAWVDFPTSATVSNGTFATYVETGRSGANRFRVVDTSTSRTSRPVVVQVS